MTAWNCSLAADKRIFELVDLIWRALRFRAAFGAGFDVQERSHRQHGIASGCWRRDNIGGFVVALDQPQDLFNEGCAAGFIAHEAAPLV